MPGWYFVTVCTKERQKLFGEIVDKEMVLNKLGLIIRSKILEIPNHFKGVEVDNFVVMPNHVHMLIWVKFVSVGNAYPSRCGTGMRSKKKDKLGRNAYMRSVLNVNECLNIDSRLDVNKSLDIDSKLNINECLNIDSKLNVNKSLDIKPKLDVNKTKMLIPKIVQNFKAAVSREFGMKIWQRSYYDKIVRNKLMLDKVNRYIKDNSKMWDRDRNNLSI